MTTGVETGLNGAYWCEELRDLQTDKVHGYLYFLFFSPNEVAPKDKLVLASINPLICLFLQAIDRDDALHQAASRFASLAGR